MSRSHRLIISFSLIGAAIFPLHATVDASESVDGAIFSVLPSITQGIVLVSSGSGIENSDVSNKVKASELPSEIYLSWTAANGETRSKCAAQNRYKGYTGVRYSFNIGTAYVGTSLQISGFNPNQLELKHTNNSKVFDFRNGKIELNAVVSTRTLIVLGIRGTTYEINIEIMKIEKTK